LFVWVKLNPSSSGVTLVTENRRKQLIVDGNIYSGMGSWSNSSCEYVLLGKRGKGLPRIARNVKQVLFAPRGVHSRKPCEVYDRIDALFGTNLRKLELFARPPIPEGWRGTGLDYDGNDIRNSIYELIKE